MTQFPYITVDNTVLQQEGRQAWIYNQATHSIDRFTITLATLDQYAGTRRLIFADHVMAIHYDRGAPIAVDRLNHDTYSIRTLLDESTGQTWTQDGSTTFRNNSHNQRRSLATLLNNTATVVTSIERVWDRRVFTVGDNVWVNGIMRRIMGFQKNKGWDVALMSNGEAVRLSAIEALVESLPAQLQQQDPQPAPQPTPTAQRIESFKSKYAPSFYQAVPLPKSEPPKPILKYPDFTKIFDEDSELKTVRIEEKQVALSYECGDILLFQDGHFEIKSHIQ